MLAACASVAWGVKLSCQRSSVVEQRFRKPSVKSSTLFAGSIFEAKYNSYGASVGVIVGKS